MMPTHARAHIPALGRSQEDLDIPLWLLQLQAQTAERTPKARQWQPIDQPPWFPLEDLHITMVNFIFFASAVIINFFACFSIHMSTTSCTWLQRLKANVRTIRFTLYALLPPAFVRMMPPSASLLRANKTIPTSVAKEHIAVAGDRTSYWTSPAATDNVAAEKLTNDISAISIQRNNSAQFCRGGRVNERIQFTRQWG